jgi:hypothetical protein
VPSDDQRRDRMLAGDLMKDLHALEFLEPAEPSQSWQRTRRHVLLDRLSDFLRRFDKSFCLVERDAKVPPSGLIMYHRELRALVLGDLQMTGTGVDLAPMRSYLARADRFLRVSGDQESIGIVIWCGDADLDVEIVFIFRKFDLGN